MKHQAIRFIRVADSTAVGPDQAFTKDGTLKSGFTLATHDQSDRAISDKKEVRHEPQAEVF